MTEHDRVLDAFRNCITEPKCKDCPWTECITLDNGNVEIPRDLALAVMRELVAQEPRVMTPQDFDGNPMKDQYGNLPCWLESRDPLVASNWCRWNEDDFIRPIMMLNFRPWTSRPTEEQRQAVKWDAAD